MTLKELQRLKKLDITTLPVSEWNDAKSVLGLDAEKDVIMSATDEFATQQQVEDALVSANTYTDAAIEGLHIPTKTSDLENDSDFATEEYVDAAVTAVTLDSYTKEEADEKFATKEEIPSLDGYATENWVTGYTYDKETIDDKIASGGTFDPENYYTKAEVDDIVTAATEGLATEAYVDAAVSSVTVDAYTKAESDAKFATKEEIPSLDGYATEAYVTAATQGLASEEYVDAAVTAATDDMATETWVQSQGYLTEHQDISGKLDKTDFNTYTGATAEVLAEKADKSEIPSLDGYATEAYVTAATEGLASEDYVDAAVTAGTQDMATQTWVGQQGYITDAALDGYATESGVTAAITAATDDMATETWVGQQGYITNAALEGYATESGVTAAITAATEGLASEDYVDAAVTAGTQDMATQTWVGQQGYITNAALEGYATESGVTAAITAATDGLASESYVDAAVTAGTEGLASEQYVDAAITAATEDQATKTWVGQQGYITDAALVGYATESGVTAAITAATDGLASEEYVDASITAATDDMATQTYVSGFTYDKDTIDEKIASGGTFDPTNYYTKSQVDNIVTAATDGLASESYVDAAITAGTQDMATQTWVGQQGYITDAALEGYATESGVTAAITAATDDMATQTWVNEQGFLTEHQDISGKLDKSDFNTYTGATADEIAAKLDKTDFNTYTGATATVLEGKADISDIPDVSSFVTSGEVETQITSKGYITDAALAGYATESGVTNAITAATAGLASEDYVDAAVTAATEDMATETWVGQQGYITDAALEGYATESGVTAAITAATDDMATETWVGNQGYLTQHQSLAGLAASVSYDSSAKTIYFYDKDGTVLNTNIDTTDFVKDGMVNNVEIVNGNLVITFNTDAGKEAITIPLTDIFDPSNYYTKTEVDAAITAATEGLASESYVDSAITAATDDLASESYVDAAVTAGTQDMATQTWVQNQGYLTEHQDISGKLDVSDFDTYTGATATVLEGKADISDIPDVSNFVTSGDVETQITSKGYITDAALAGYATESGVTNAITAATDGLASESYVDAAVTAGTQDMATQTWVGQQGYITDAALDGYATESGVTAAITAATEGLASESYVTNAVTAATEGMATQSFVTGITSGLQETLVSGTNIKTINNESILGSGNITIQGGVDVDDNFSTGSTNPVENRVITNEILYLEHCINEKQDELVSGTNIKTVNHQSLLGSGDISVTITVDSSLSTGSTNPVQNKVVTAALNKKANTTDIPDVSSFVTSGDVETQITSKGYITDAALAGYATESGVTAAITAATDGLASEEYVNAAITAATDDLASESYVDAAVTAATEDMATQSFVTGITSGLQETLVSGTNIKTVNNQSLLGSGDISVTITVDDSLSTGSTNPVQNKVITAALNNKANTTDIPDVSDFVTSGDVETQITSKGYITDAALSGYATESGVTAAITAATDDMATETWVQNQGYLTEHQDISGKLDVSDFDTYTGATATVLEGKADISDIPDVSNFVTSGDVETQITSKGYITDAALAGYATESGVTAAITAATEGLASESYVDAAVTAGTQDMATQTWVGQQGYISQSDVDTEMSDSSTDPVQNKVIKAYADTKAKVISLTQAQYDALSGNTESGTTYYITDAPALITQTDLTNAITAATEGLASESYVDAAVTAGTQDMATQTWVGQQGYITDAALDGYATESGVTNAITAATAGLASESYVNAAITAATDDLASESYVDAAVTAATQGLATESGVTEALAEKADIATTSTTVYETTSTVITGFTTPWNDNRYVIINGSAVSELTGVTENGESSDWYVVYDANGLSGNFYLSNDTGGMLSFGNYETVTNHEIGKVYNFGNLTSASIAVPALVLNGEKYVFIRMNYDTGGDFDSYDAMVSNSLTVSEVKNVVYSDEMPTAQDGSGVNYFVYKGSGSKGVVAGISSSYSQFSDKFRLINSYRLWGSNGWNSTYVDIPPVDSTNAGVATPAMLSEILKVSAATNVQGTHVIGTGDTGYKATIISEGVDIPFYEADGGAYAIATIEFTSLNQRKLMVLADPETYPMGFVFGSSTQFYAASLPVTITYDGPYLDPPLPSFVITNNTTTANKTVYFIMDMSTKDVEITDTLSYTGGQKTLATTDLVATALQYAIAMAQSIVNSAVANKVVGTGITNITKISRSDYESLATKNSNTLYVIED